MSMEKQQIIQVEVEGLFQKMGFPAEINVTVLGEASYSIRVTVEEGSKLLIGQHGVALSALQYIIRSILTRKLQERA
ncbi:MAG: hypothetical protein QG581_474, partial [Patescibacteria group bacterium]|nr:hypothetical protein [Patescibacteria group bacterium]